jgi:3-phenylpropionate/trans-cinnamate dioxygenase ferredoxin reductase subunit
MLRRAKANRSGGAPQGVVIVGAGQAGAQAAFTLRDQGFRGPITLVGEEPQLPYQRPPLSKKFLSGQLSVERLLLRPHSAYLEQSIHLHLHSRVLAIDRARQRVHVQNGRPIPYDMLLLAIGSRPKGANVPGARANGVHYLRTLQDAFGLRKHLNIGTRLAVVGGGYVGLEVAATARALGAAVVVFEADDRIMKRVTSSAIANYFTRLHAANGVEIHCGAMVEAFDAGERLEGIFVDGKRWSADTVLIGVGAQPNVELAEACGLACDTGIIVDEYCRTSDPRIFAAGDCTSHYNVHFRSRLRLESVQNAVDQATCAALNMVGRSTAYRDVPWFWTQQYDCKLQSVGMCTDYEEIETRGAAASGRLALLYYAGGELIGCDAINLPREFMEVRKRLHDRADSSVAMGAAPHANDSSRHPAQEPA